MHGRRRRALILLILAGLLLLVWRLAPRHGGGPAALLPLAPLTEAQARAEFLRAHPGEKPLNWRIAEVAEEFHRTQPMGRFVLDKNDCSDFVDCIADEALGVGARFRRNSDQHLYAGRRDVWQWRYWDRRSPLLPGDIVSVRHSPWYAPHETLHSHVGVIGTSGQVCDFTKLISWRTARYGHNPVSWFVRNSPGATEIVIQRLAPEYRYMVRELPGP
jgi:hypothetical protein